MYGYLFQDGVELLLLKPVRCVFPVLGGDIPRNAGFTTVLVFGALKNYLYSVSFFCHILMCLLLKTLYKSFTLSLFEGLLQTQLIDKSQTGCRNPEVNPTVFFLQKKFLIKQVYLKGPFGLALGMRNIVAHLRRFSGNLTNSRHV
jgi:hypothetical protein